MITGTDRPPRKVSVCIGCGCDDEHACILEVGGFIKEACYWLEVDRTLGRGVCSGCPRKLAAWRKGNRELSEPARVAIEMRNLAKATRKPPIRCPGFRPPRRNPLTKRVR